MACMMQRTRGQRRYNSRTFRLSCTCKRQTWSICKQRSGARRIATTSPECLSALHSPGMAKGYQIGWGELGTGAKGHCLHQLLAESAPLS
ncbi:hypothetical protein VTO42DRAFT_5576 [Malbranchea cinnamomea]